MTFFPHSRAYHKINNILPDRREMGLRVTIFLSLSLSLVPYSPQGMARYRLPSGLSTSLTGYAANCRPYNYHIGQINIGLPLVYVLASATVGDVYVSVLY